MARTASQLTPRTSRDRAEARGFRDNPFLQMEESILPSIPPDPDGKWSYLWMRVDLGAKTDGSNIVKHLSHRVPYEVVRPSEMPRFEPLKAINAAIPGAGDCIRVQDVILVRIPTEMRDLQMEAEEIKAQRAAEAIKENQRGKFSDDRARFLRRYSKDSEEHDGMAVSLKEDDDE